MSALPHFSDIDLLGYSERVINLDSEISNRARSSCGQVGAEPREDFLFSYRSALPSFCGANVCHRSMDQGRSLPVNTPIVLRTAACSDALPDRVQGRGMG